MKHTRTCLVAAAALLVTLVAATCGAHAVGVSRGEYGRGPEGLEARLAFARSELAALGGEARVVRGIDVRPRDATSPCTGELVTSRALENDGVELSVRFRCRRDAGPLRVSLAPLLSELGRGHRHEAVAAGGVPALLFEGHSELDVAAANVAVDAPESTAERGLPGFVRLGVEHILTGYDHLVFLLGLVLAGFHWRRTVTVVSAFTLAHSLSLAASVLGAWTPPSSLVEAAIALSIAYVGVENLLGRSNEHRARLAFGFGLVHGFGFASALSEVRFRGLELARALFGFNAGVELGQLTVLALLVPAVALLAKRPTWSRHAVRGTNVAVALSGAVWFVARVAGAQG